jgi:thioesterase domain-containing protein
MHHLPSPDLSVEKRLAEIWLRVLDVEAVGLHDDFFRLGGGSLAAAHVIIEIRKAFGLDLPMAAFIPGSTIASLARIIRRPERLSASPCLVGLQPKGDRAPFFCVHPVGGTVLGYANLARQFPLDQPFYGLRAVAPSGAEASASPSVPDLASRYIEAVRSLQPEGPYYLGGYSFGGSVALEMAQQLHAAGQEVALLAILDHTPPPTRYRLAIRRPWFLIEFLLNVPHWIRDDLVHYGARKVLEGLQLRFRALRNRWRARFGRAGNRCSPPEVDRHFDLTRMPDDFRKLLANHYQALREYQPRVYRGRVVLFRARTRPLFGLYGRDLGWAKLAGGGLEIIIVPGNHETMLKEPHLHCLAQRLLHCLRNAQVARQIGGRACPAELVQP